MSFSPTGNRQFAPEYKKVIKQLRTLLHEGKKVYITLMDERMPVDKVKLNYSMSWVHAIDASGQGHWCAITRIEDVEIEG